MPPGKGRYTIGAKGTHGCSGYPVVGGEGTVHGCHKTRSAAMNQQAAIYASQNQKEKAQMISDLAKAQEVLEKMSGETEEIYKAWSVVENHPSCNGFAVVGDSGNLHGCFNTREEAEVAVQNHTSDHNDNNDENHSDDNVKKSLDSFFAKGLPASPKRVNTTGNAQFEMDLKGLTERKPFG